MKFLTEKKNDLIVRAEEILNKAKFEKRELTEEESQELQKIKEDVERIKKTIELQDDFREMELKEGQKEKEEEEGTSEEENLQEEEEERAIKETKAFEKFIRGFAINIREDDTPVNLEKGANGAVIPQTIADKIIKKVYDISPVLEKSTKYNIKGTLTIPYYDEETTAINVGYQEEFTQMQSSSGKFTNTITLTGFLAGALTKVSRSLINNAQFNIVDFIIDAMAESIARFIEKELLVGTQDKVAGLSNLTNVITADAADAITADDIIKLHDAIKDRYQGSAMWIMSNQTRTALRLLKDSQGRYLLQDDVSQPFGASLLGKPVYVSDNMDEIASNNTVMYYGDFKGLATKFNENINIQVLRERYADEHADGVIGWFEFDAKVEDAQKIAKLVMADA